MSAYKRTISRCFLDQTCQRATPRQCSSYITTLTEIKIVYADAPKRLNGTLTRLNYANKHPSLAPFLAHLQ